MSAVEIDLTRVTLGTVGVSGWDRKDDAKAVLERLREAGRNATRKEEIHRAGNRFFRFWVVGRPDPLAEFTWLMSRDGTWARGRLVDQYDRPAVWVSVPGPQRIPATITHNYGYSAGTVGVSDGHGKPLLSYGWDGRGVERTGWLTSAWCVACTWSTNGSDESSTRAAGRHHRDNPGGRPLRPLR